MWMLDKIVLASLIANRSNKLMWLHGDILSSNPDKLIVLDNSSKSSSLTSEETTLLIKNSNNLILIHLK